MENKYISKVFSVNSAGNYIAQIDPNTSLFIANPEQDSWNEMIQPSIEGDEYPLHIVFTINSLATLTSQHFTFSKRSLDLVTRKIDEILTIPKWSDEIYSITTDEQSIHLNIADYFYAKRLQKLYLSMYWQEEKLSFYANIATPDLDLENHYIAGYPINYYCERLSSIAFPRDFVPELNAYFKSYQTIVSRRETLIKQKSPAECAFEEILQRHLPQIVFTEQVPFLNKYTNKVNYIDYALEPIKLAIEIDGKKYHDPKVIDKNEWEYQVKRDRALKLAGWKLLRFTAKEVFQQPQVIVKDILSELNK